MKGDKERVKGRSHSPAAWRSRAEDLAGWASRRLVNRVDVWGSYGEAGSWTAPAVKDRGRQQLTLGLLRQHFTGRTIGLHSTSPDNTSLWGAVDVDAHDGGRADPEANLAAALAWYERLAALGFRPLLTDSNGRGGFHLRVLFADPVPTPEVFALLHWLTSDHQAHGLEVRPESFPKQPQIRPGGFGNWLRVPGRHHKRDHWSTVWDGSRWLEGAGAVETILRLTGEPAELVPPEARQLPDPPRPRVMAGRAYYGSAASLPPTVDGLVRRITAYLERLPNLGAGEGRHKVAFGFAAWLVRDLGVDDHAAVLWLNAWDLGNTPPMGLEELVEVVACAREYGHNPVGCGLGGKGARACR